MSPFVTCGLQGRMCNQIYQIATTIAYAKRHGLDYYIPDVSRDSDEFYFSHLNLPLRTHEVSAAIKQTWAEHRDTLGVNTYYQEIPKMENVCLDGYFQTFKYFDDCRDEILSVFKIPYSLAKGWVGIHVRRGDYITYSNNFPPLSIEYYKKSINYFIERGYTNFLCCSDDIPYCKETLPALNSSANFEYSENKTPLEDVSFLSCCEHLITANSSFSMMASWLNQNPNKLTICPTDDIFFVGMNKDMVPNTPNYIRMSAPREVIANRSLNGYGSIWTGR